MADKKIELTEAGSHVATARGQASTGLIEPGEAIPPGVPVGSWMKRVAPPAKEEGRKGVEK